MIPCRRTLSSATSTTTPPSNDVNTTIHDDDKHTTTTTNVSTTTTSVKLPPWLEEILQVVRVQSGTQEIWHLKEQVARQAEAFDASTRQVTAARQDLATRLQQWETVNGQHLQLLQRRDKWTAADAKEFGGLVEQEIAARETLEQARAHLTQAEQDQHNIQLEYMNAMRKRYHEEQIWQDQWRILSTYGTWSLLVLNSALFLASQLFHYQREAIKMKHLEDLVRKSVHSQQEFQDQILEQQQQQQQQDLASSEGTGIFSIFGSSVNTNDASHENHSDKESASKTVEEAATKKEDSSSSPLNLFAEEEASTVVDSSTTTHTPPNNMKKEGIDKGKISTTERWEDADEKDSTSSRWSRLQGLVSSSQKVVQHTTKRLAHTLQQQTQAFIEDVHPPSVALGAGAVMLATLWLSSSTK